MPDPSAAALTLKKSRYFLALIPPADIQADVTDLKHHFRERYQSQAALRSPPHITLQPPFEWPDSDRDRLSSTLALFRPPTRAVPIVLSGFGAFPPRVIFLAVRHTPELMQLQAELSGYLAAQLKIEASRSRDRAFQPHLTLAFQDLQPAAFREAWSIFEHKSVVYTFTATAIELLRHTGHEWNSIETFPMK